MRLEPGQSSREATAACLKAIADLDPELGAFRCVRGEAALAEADAADRLREQGDERPLLGVPVAIKDDTDLAGETTPFGCGGTFEAAAEDAEAVRRLRAAGMIIVGKTNTPEVGQWPITESTSFGVTRNPWNLQRTPGGSSGGSATAVAAGMVPAALGSDGLGSVRVPAAWTHLIGIKPQRGRISTWPQPEAFNGLACVGPLARTVEDAAALLDAASGNRSGDVHRPPPPAQPFARAAEREPGRLRIALSLRIPFAVAPTQLDPDVRAAVAGVAEALAALGHEVHEADPSYGVLGVGVLPRSLSGLHDWLRRLPDHEALDPRTRHNAAIGRVLRPLLAPARALEAPMRRQVGAIFRRVDVVLTPTTAQPAIPVGGIDGLGGWATDQRIIAACPYTWPWNVIGWPAISVPAGVIDGASPVGAQLLGPEGSEAMLISLAAQLQDRLRWHDRVPPNSVYAVA